MLSGSSRQWFGWILELNEGDPKHSGRDRLINKQKPWVSRSGLIGTMSRD
jgi:hypothetical protein